MVELNNLNPTGSSKVNHCPQVACKRPDLSGNDISDSDDDTCFSLHSHVNTGLDLFWLLLGVFDEEKILVKDPAFQAFSFFGHLFFIVYVVCMVIVALNMLIAMMNKSFENITVSRQDHPYHAVTITITTTMTTATTITTIRITIMVWKGESKKR